MKDAFIRRHRELEPWAVHPKLAPVLGETVGIMLYENDAIQVAAALAGVPHFNRTDFLLRGFPRFILKPYRR